MNEFPKEKVLALFQVADIPVLNVWELANQYWPRPQFEAGREDESLHYAQLCLSSPWWLVKTPWGCIEIGWRKRVISIDWRDTGLLAGDLVDDDVTKSHCLIHAWSELKAAEYLSILKRRLVERNQLV